MRRRPALLLPLLLALPAGFAAAQGTSVHIDELTWSEVRERLAAGTTTIIVPIGGTEQNGPAMVLGKHNVRVRLLAGRIATGLGRALVAPVIAYVPQGPASPPTGHMRFAGTVTVPEPVFEATLEAAARSFRQHGFREVVFIGDHGGYQRNMARVADRLNREWGGRGARVHAVEEYYRVVEGEYLQALRQRGFGDEEIGLHAGLADTSLSLALDPRLVRTERLGAPASAAEGVRGDPARSSSALGQLGVDLIVSRTIEAIRRRTTRD